MDSKPLMEKLSALLVAVSFKDAFPVKLQKIVKLVKHVIVRQMEDAD